MKIPVEDLRDPNGLGLSTVSGTLWDGGQSPDYKHLCLIWRLPSLI